MLWGTSGVLIYRQDAYISVKIKCMWWNRYFCASQPQMPRPFFLPLQGWAHGWTLGRWIIWDLKRQPSAGLQNWALCSKVRTISFSIWHYGFNLQDCFFHASLQWDLFPCPSCPQGCISSLSWNQTRKAWKVPWRPCGCPSLFHRYENRALDGRTLVPQVTQLDRGEDGMINAMFHPLNRRKEKTNRTVHSVLDSGLGVIMYFNFWDALRSRFKYLVSQMRCFLYYMFLCMYMHVLFYHTLLYCTSQILWFVQIQGSWQSFIKQVSFSQHLLIMCLCIAFWWFLPYFSSPPSFPCPASKKIMTLWRLRWWLAFILFYFIILATPCSLWDLSSLTRDWTHAPCSGSAQNPNRRTTGEVPAFFSNEVFLN